MTTIAGAVARPEHIRPRRWCVEHPHCLAAQEGAEHPVDGDALARGRRLMRLFVGWAS